MALDEWQQRLSDHFRQLQRTRSASGIQRSVFALEHGLDTHERDALAAEVRTHLSTSFLWTQRTLPWVVYAAEVGYRYAGDEYWQTFAEETPGWERLGDRAWIRQCFRTFHEQFGGAQPAGAWANHFSIICWPVTHAILPQDLQLQLAEILYKFRDQYSADLLTSPSALGARIAAWSWNATSRFKYLAQEPLLIGQIATALLLQGAQGSERLILPATLKRIGADLDRTRLAREWLRGAQRVAQQRVQFRGLSSSAGQSATASRPTSGDRAREQVAALAIEPRLVLRPTGADSWDVLLELPDLNHLLLKFPALRGVLTESRCVVAGSSGRALARGALLHGRQLVILRSWPNPADFLLRFEQTVAAEFDYLLRAECLLRPGPRWLFRIASDGLAYELRGNLVRPGQSYVLLSSGAPIKASPSMTGNRLACEGIHAARLDVPTAVSEEWAGHLAELGLNQARGVHVWPAGLPAASWDGEGRGEWLTTERPCIGIRPDHAVAAISVRLGTTGDQRLDVASPDPGTPVYVELPPLSVGLHTLRVSSRSISGATDEQAGRLDIVIREPRAWVPGLGGPGALRISIDPPTPTLEQLWEGRASIEIRGPTGRPIIATAGLFERRSDAPSVRKRLPPLSLPADAGTWRAHFERHFRDAKDVQLLYDPAHACRLELNAYELGTFSLNCEREFSPLRWVVRRRATGYELSLLDDSGSLTPPYIERYEFTAPNTAVRLDAAPFSKGYSAPASGGLYRACVADFTRAVILPPAAKSLTLQDLRVEPEMQTRPRSAGAVEDLLSFIRMWSEARLTGSFSTAKTQAVLHALLHEVFAILGGDTWANAERVLRIPGGAGQFESMKRAVSEKATESSLAARLFLGRAACAASGSHDRVAWFASTARPLLPLEPPARAVNVSGAGGVTDIRRASGPAHPDWICEFALRLASAPETLYVWAAGDLQHGLEWLLKEPVLARAARFVVLAVDREPHASTGSRGRIYRGWGWEE